MDFWVGKTIVVYLQLITPSLCGCLHTHIYSASSVLLSLVWEAVYTVHIYTIISYTFYTFFDVPPTKPISIHDEKKDILAVFWSGNVFLALLFPFY